MNWDLLLDKAAKAYYTEFLANLASLLVIIVYFSKKKKAGSMLYLVVLAIAGLLQSIVVQYIRSQPAETALDTRIKHDSLYVYLIIEFACCLLFIRSHLRSKAIKKMALPCIAAFTLFTIYYWLGKPSFTDFYAQVPAVEGFLIIIPCVYFFYELLTGDLHKDLFTEPAFWAISGILVLFTIITPVFLLLNYFIQNRTTMFYRLYITNNMAYALLFITFAVAIASTQKSTGRKSGYYN